MNFGRSVSKLGWALACAALIAKAPVNAQTYSRWRMTGTSQEVTPGELGAIEQIEAKATGGSVLFVRRPDPGCKSAPQKFRFTWRFEDSVAVVAGKQGAKAFLAHLAIEKDGGGPCLSSEGFMMIGATDLFARDLRGGARFYSDANHSFHAPGPRVFSLGKVSDRTALVDLIFWVHRAGELRIWYKFEATALDTPPGASPSATPSPPVSPPSTVDGSTGGTTSGGGIGPGTPPARPGDVSGATPGSTGGTPGSGATDPSGAASGGPGDPGAASSGGTQGTPPGTGSGGAPGSGSGGPSGPGSDGSSSGMVGLPVPGSAGRVLQAARRTAWPGNTVLAPVYIFRPDGAANSNFLLRYDPKVAQVDGKVRKGPVLGSSMIAVNPNPPGVIRIGFAQTTGLSQDGIVAFVPFKAVGKAGDRTPLTLELDLMQDARGAPLPVGLVAGELRILGPGDGEPGDCDGQAGLSARDAQCALDMSVQLIPVNLNMDVDSDGRVTSGDARTILGRIGQGPGGGR